MTHTLHLRSKTSLILIALCAGVCASVVYAGTAHAQTLSDPSGAVAQALATLKDEEARLMNMRQSMPPADPQSLLREEKIFLHDAVQVLVKRDEQLQQQIVSRPDVFNVDDARVLSGQIDLNKNKFGEFNASIEAASSSDELKQVAHDIYVYRTSQETAVNRPILSAYLDYFGNSVLQSVINRYQQTQDKITTLKDAGKDVTTLQPLLDAVSLTIAQANVSFLTLKNKVGNDTSHSTAFESDLLALQNMIKSIYDQFRQIAIEGGGLLGVPVTQDAAGLVTYSSASVSPSPSATSSTQ